MRTSCLIDCTRVFSYFYFLLSFFIFQADNNVSLVAREEMAALYLLTNLTAPAARLWSLELPNELRRRPLMSTALQMAAATAQHNYVRFTRLLHRSGLSAPYQLAARRTAGQLLAGCLRVMNTAYSSPACRYPLQHLAGLLQLGPTALRQHCLTAGIKVEGTPGSASSSIQFSKSSWSSIPAEGLDLLLADSYCHRSWALSGEEWRSFLLGSERKKARHEDPWDKVSVS